MAEENKVPEVELDTDGVQEQSVEVTESQNEPDPTEIKKEEVDLGYTDHSEKRTYEKQKDHGTDISYENEREQKLEQKEEPEEKGDLGEYSDKVQKRIKKLTFQIREAERREKAALEYAKGIKDKFDNVSQKYEETDTNYLKQYDARIDSERDKAKATLKAALDENNTVDKEIPVQYREDWVRLVNNLKLPKVRREAITNIIMQILKEHHIDPETW